MKMRRAYYINCALLLWIFIPVVLRGQDPSAKITVGLGRYWEQRPPLIHLTFHQPEYAAADTAFFNARLVQRGTFLPVRGPQVMNLRLLDNANSQVAHVRVLLKDGAGAGYIALAADRKPGIHTVQAFTDEMTLNGDTASFLQLPFLVTGREQNMLRPVEQVIIKSEGNHFVAGVMNRLVVQSATPFQGNIVDNEGKIIVAEVASDKYGWMNFSLSPEAGRKYFLRIDKSMYPLPEPEVDGVAMQVLPGNDAGQYLLSVNAPRAGIWHGKQIRVVVSSAGQPPVFYTITPGSSSSLPFNVVSEGINTITLLSVNGEVIAERLLYRAPEKSVVMTAATQSQPGTREAVPVDIVVGDEQRRPINGNFSLTVYHDEMFLDDDSPGAFFRFKLWLQSELGLNGTDTPVESALWNDYLVVHYTETIPWIALQEGSHHTRLKTNPYYFRANVFYADSRKAVPDSTAVTFYLNRYDVIFGLTVNNGAIEFPLFMTFGNDEVYYKATLGGKTLKGVKVVPVAVQGPVPPTWNAVALKEVDQYGDFAGIRQNVNDSYSFYDENRKAEDDDEVTAEDWNVDVVVDLEKVITFADVNETLREVVPAVKVRQQDGQFTIRVFMKESATFATDPPVFIIDGTMTDSTAYFLSLDPKKLARIGVIRSKAKMARYGAIGSGGLILVESKGSIYASAARRSSHVLSIVGIQKPIDFPSREESADRSGRLPDLRPVLYWQPSMVLKDGKATFTCHTSDLSGKFKLMIEGFTDKGAFIRAATNLDVKFMKP